MFQRRRATVSDGSHTYSPKGRYRRPLLLAVAPVAAAVFAPSVSATDRFWVTTNGPWNTAADWNTIQGGGGVAGAPASGDNAFVLFTDAVPRVITYVNPGFAGAFNTVSFDNAGTGTSTLSQSQDVLSAATENFGVNGSGFYVAAAGTNNVLSLNFAVNAGSKGLASISGSTTLNLGVPTNSGSLTVGVSGNGTVTQSGGTITFAGTTFSKGLLLAQNVGATGTYNLQSGSLNLGSLNTFVGYSGAGVFNQSGGSHGANTLYLGFFGPPGGGPAANGIYNLSGGTLRVTFENIGQNGNGTFNQSNGANTVLQQFFVGGLGNGTAAASTGVYNQSGGTLVVGNTETVGNQGTGTFNQTGGTNNAQGGLLIANSTNAGSYSLSNGANLSVINREVVGASGPGSFVQFGGTHTILNFLPTTGLVLGNATSATGSYSLLDGSLQITGTQGVTAVGSNGAGSFYQAGGTHTTPLLYLGVNDGSVGNYNLSGGSLNVTTEIVGLDGVASFYQGAGTHLVSADLIVGQSNPLPVGGATSTTGASFVVQDGALTVSHTLTVGQFSVGQFYQYGGTVSVSSLQVGARATASGSIYFHTGGTLAASNGAAVGIDSNGEYDLGGGTATLNGLNPLIVGQFADGTGRVAIGGGTLSAPNPNGLELIGNAGVGKVDQFGGTHNAAFVSLGAAAGGQGVYNLSGFSTFNATGLFLGTGPATDTLPAGSGTVTMSGGTLNVGSVSVGASGPGAFTQSGGVHTAGVLSIGFNATGIGAYALQAGTLNATVEQVGASGSGTFTQTGGTHVVATSLTIAQNFGSVGSYTLSGGTLTAPVINNGTFTQLGGSVAGSFTNNGSLNFNVASPFSAALVQTPAGTFNVNAAFTSPGGVTNAGTINVATGASLTTNTLPLDNEGGSVNLNGGTLGGSGGVLNNGVISGFGTLAGGGTFTNNGQLNQGPGNLLLNRTGSTLNNGAINLAAGRQLQLQSPLANAASLNLNGGFVTGPQPLSNAPGAIITGPGTITAPLNTNAGTILVQGGSLNVTQPLSNVGTIQVNGLAATLLGASIANAGTVQGFGNVNNALDNTGTVEPLGGTLALTGAVTNEPTGVLRAATGNKLLLSTGLAAPNLGTINLVGGTVDANGHPLVNANTITGFGTLATGGLTNAANAAITFSGGLATINGPVTNAAGGTVRVSYNPALFTHPVTNNGNFKITATTVTFAAPFTNNGLYASDPATTHYSTLTVGPSGALAGGPGDKFYVSGDFLSASAQRTEWDTATGAELHFESGDSTGNHTLTLTGSDLGPTPAGYVDNFAWGTLALDPAQSLTLADGDSTPGGALYTSTLSLPSAPTDNTLATYIATHLLNANATTPMDVYYDPTQPANAYLHAATYPLGNGGLLAPVTAVPEPTALAALFGTGALLLRRRRTRTPQTK